MKGAAKGAGNAAEDARGYIIHRDFDAVRISSGQLINKGH